MTRGSFILRAASIGCIALVAATAQTMADETKPMSAAPAPLNCAGAGCQYAGAWLVKDGQFYYCWVNTLNPDRVNCTAAAVFDQTGHNNK